MQKAEPLALKMNPDGYYLAFSGGKDSQAIFQLAIMAKVKFKAYMNLTSIDPTEVIRFVRQHYPQVAMIKPKQSIYDMAIKKHILPTRKIRWCCEEYKETSGVGYVTITGIRKEESAQRAKRQSIERQHKNKNKRQQFTATQVNKAKEYFIQCINGKEKIIINPILEWTEKEVWQFLNNNNLPHCTLYDKGYKRIGCICCPQSSYKQKIKEITDYPHVKYKWLQVCKTLKDKGYTKYELTPKEMFQWYISGISYKKWYAQNKQQTKFNFINNEHL